MLITYVTSRKSELGLNHLDGDSDDDGVLDGDEDDWAFDADGDGLINVLDADSDNDYLPDGLEKGMSSASQFTDINLGYFIPDLDTSTQSWMQLRDSDNGGAFDGEEDPTRDGVVGEGDTDPNDPEDDMFANIDVDDDGLLSEEDSNHNGIFEPELGETDPFNADSDGDSILDGEEVGDTTDPRDSDEDGVIDALDSDSDGDSIPDSVESGDTDINTAPIDSDFDLIPDYLDEDSDGDTISDRHENASEIAGIVVDTDEDGRADYLDLDSDQDGFRDDIEAGDTDLETAPVDSDGDGTPDFQDKDTVTEILSQTLRKASLVTISIWLTLMKMALGITST